MTYVKTEESLIKSLWLYHCIMHEYSHINKNNVIIVYSKRCTFSAVLLGGPPLGGRNVQ